MPLGRERQTVVTRRVSTTNKVMVIDDDPFVLSTAATGLTKTLPGVEVYTFGDAESALQACPELDPDLVFLDLDLPGMDGLEAAPKLKAMLREQTPVIVLTATRKSAMRDRPGALAYITEWLVKPLTVDDLRRIAGRYLGHERADVSEEEDAGPPLALQSAYRQRVSVSRSEVERTMNKYDPFAGTFRPTDFSELRELLHKLAGASGLFGFAAIGEAASRAELALDERQQDPSPEKDACLYERLVELMTEFKAVN